MTKLEQLKAENVRLADHIRVMEQQTRLEIIYKGNNSALHDLLAPTIELLKELSLDCAKVNPWVVDRSRNELARLRALTERKE